MQDKDIFSWRNSSGIRETLCFTAECLQVTKKTCPFRGCWGAPSCVRCDAWQKTGAQPRLWSRSRSQSRLESVVLTGVGVGVGVGKFSSTPTPARKLRLRLRQAGVGVGDGVAEIWSTPHHCTGLSCSSHHSHRQISRPYDMSYVYDRSSSLSAGAETLSFPLDEQFEVSQKAPELLWMRWVPESRRRCDPWSIACHNLPTRGDIPQWPPSEGTLGSGPVRCGLGPRPRLRPRVAGLNCQQMEEALNGWLDDIQGRPESVHHALTGRRGGGARQWPAGPLECVRAGQSHQYYPVPTAYNEATLQSRWSMNTEHAANNNFGGLYSWALCKWVHNRDVNRKPKFWFTD